MAAGDPVLRPPWTTPSVEVVGCPLNTIFGMKLIIADSYDGMQAFASAFASGSLASLTMIAVDTKHERHPQLMAACQARGIEIA